MPLDAMAQAFEAEMLAQERAGKLRPASTRRTDDIDNLSAAGAERLARTIRKYWENAGFDVAVEIVPFHCASTNGQAFAVRSDLRGGLPAPKLDK